jgi:hypothetical protein
MTKIEEVQIKFAEIRLSNGINVEIEDEKFHLLNPREKSMLVKIAHKLDNKLKQRQRITEPIIT